MTFTEQKKALIAEMRSIVDGAKDRDLTEAESRQFYEKELEVKQLDVKIAESNKSAKQRDALVGLGPDEPHPAYKKRQGYGSPPKGYLSPEFKSLAEHIASKMAPDGAKALAPAGTILFDVPMVEQSPIELGRPSQTLWDLIPTVKQTEPQYSYLRQTVRTNNAAVVAVGAAKPTSVFTVAKVDGRLRVVAHLSEAIDKFMLEDNTNLVSFIQNEMIAGLYDAIATEVISGDGTGEHLTGLANTSGIQLQSAGVDGLATLRSALTKLENVNTSARGFALNAADWEEIETTRNTSGNFDVGGPIDAASRRAWGVPVSVVPGVPAGTAYAIGENTVTLRQQAAGVQVDWAAPGDLFSKNQLQARVETRVNLDVLRPVGIVKITLP
jgi:HK97 family phage major capsid protein